jgi:two-component system chemotaxis response regulator CheY
MAHTILIVDDSLLARAFMEKALELSGVEIGEIITAKNGREALDLLEQKTVDIIFADINMPEMNGIELVHHMAETGRLAEIPVVIVSTERSEVRIEDLEKDGIVDYITKPYTPEHLREVVNRIFETNAGSES